jgi:hypothetical protein
LKALDLVPYNGKTVALGFADGESIRARIVSVDPDVVVNHVFYELLAVVNPGPSGRASAAVGDLAACSAHDITSVNPE